MSQTLAAIIAIVVGGVFIVGMAVVYLMIQDRVLDWWWGRKHPPEPRERYLARLRSPDWELVRQELGDVPPALKSWFESENVLREYLLYGGTNDEDWEYQVAGFQPLDEGEFSSRWPGNDVGCVPFGGDGLGNVVFLKEGTGPQWPVYFFDHEGGEDELVADSLEEFLTNLRDDSSCDE